MYKKIRQEAIIVAVSLLIGLAASAIYATKVYSDSFERDLSQRFIRFHVLANSDSEVDQQLKLMVRDEVLSVMKDRLSSCKDINESRELISASFPLIKETAEKAMRAQGFYYNADVSLSRGVFPTREYGDIVLVSGDYEALRIELGEAKGKNWWCVVYPPLCYVDVATKEMPKEQLKQDLSKSQYDMVANSGDPGVKIKFKLVEAWQDYKYAKQIKGAKKAFAKS